VRGEVRGEGREGQASSGDVIVGAVEPEFGEDIMLDASIRLSGGCCSFGYVNLCPSTRVL
jgi:hypothetical protein